MKFLLDENLPPAFGLILRSLGWEARHVYDVDLGNVPDEKIIDFARNTGETILTNDLDFSRIMATSDSPLPSVITFRLAALNHDIFEEIARLNFENFSEFLKKGCLVTIDENGARIKQLPIFR